MELYSQQKLRVAPTEPEHLLRKADLDAALQDLQCPCTRHRVAVGGLIAQEGSGRVTVQLLNALGVPAGRIVRNVLMLPVPQAAAPETADLIARARKDNPLNEVEIV